MKKLIALFLMILFISSLSFTEASAESPEIEWDVVNLYSTYHRAEGTLNINQGVKSVTINIPDSVYHSEDHGGMEPSIYFYDINDVAIDHIEWLSQLGHTLSGEFEIDLDAFGVLGASYMQINIPQTFDTIPGGYIDYLDANSTNVQVYYVADRDFYFIREETVSYTRIEAKVNVPYNTHTIVLQLDTIDYQVIFDSTYYSKIVLYDYADIALDTLNFKDYIEYDQTFVKMEVPYDPLDYEINDVDYFIVYLYIDEYMTFQEIDNANTSMQVFFNYYPGSEDIEDYIIDEPVVDDTIKVVIILSALGMDSTTGFIIFFIIIILIATIGLVLADVSPTIISIIDLLILILFTYWNILPLYVTVAGYIVFIVAIIMTLGGGARYE